MYFSNKILYFYLFSFNYHIFHLMDILSSMVQANGLAPLGAKPLPKPMMTKIPDALLLPPVKKELTTKWYIVTTTSANVLCLYTQAHILLRTMFCPHRHMSGHLCWHLISRIHEHLRGKLTDFLEYQPNFWQHFAKLRFNLVSISESQLHNSWHRP